MASSSCKRAPAPALLRRASLGAKITHGQLLAKAPLLGAAKRPHWAGQERVGLLLPSSVGGYVANCAALLAGKVPVNLNYTGSEESLRSSARQCGLTSILTSRAFLEKLPLPEVAPFVYLENIAAAATKGGKLAAGLAALLLPAGALARWAGRERSPGPDDTAAIIFSSGSTGEPKGVQLTHFNLTSNLQSLCQIYDVGPDDVVLGILPFFHSFGFLATLCLPACVGTGVAFHPNPLDARHRFLCRQFGGTYCSPPRPSSSPPAAAIRDFGSSSTPSSAPKTRRSRRPRLQGQVRNRTPKLRLHRMLPGLRQHPRLPRQRIPPGRPQARHHRPTVPASPSASSTPKPAIPSRSAEGLRTCAGPT